jgi:Tfp pilus assembly protein PilO
MIWREKRVLLMTLAVLLAANTVFFFTYRVQYEERLRGLDAKLEEVKEQFQQARRARAAAEQQLAGYRKIERDIEDIYTTKWATESERLTRLIAEVKRLIAQSNLAAPRSLSFQHTVEKGEGASARSVVPEAIVVGIGFTVQGNYQQIRQLINKLELSNQFVIIDQIGLNSATGDTLTMAIHVKTLFRDESAPIRRPAGNQDL